MNQLNHPKTGPLVKLSQGLIEVIFENKSPSVQLPVYVDSQMLLYLCLCPKRCSYISSCNGLYLALVLFWFIGAFKVQVRQAALYSLIVFMFGLAAGRVFSLIIDGMPHWLLVVYLVLELGFGILGILIIKRSD